MNTTLYIFLGLFAFLAGFVLFLSLVSVLKRKLKNDNLAQKAQILKEAKTQVLKIKEDAAARVVQKVQLAKEELEEELRTRTEDFHAAEAELQAQEDSAVVVENLLKKKEKELESHDLKVKAIREIVDEQNKKISSIHDEMQLKLEVICKTSKDDVKRKLQTQWIEQKQLDSQKQLKQITEELNISSKRLGSRLLSRSLARYAPEFVWPKPINHVELEDQKVSDMWASEAYPLIANLRDISGATIELINERQENQANFRPHVKLVGGYGIYREASRLALEELKTKNPQAWNSFKEVYERNVEALQVQALKLGKRAVRELRIKALHPEIMRMIGSLNWRTSYRQNQFLHSLEVARLSGMLADELGVDPEHAKRCGLLHDIGKSIDYRIEGSHAVISGDYADRYGESRLICDSVMSHHNDLRVETPLAFVLKAADTLSGARPGARVNLEEGYQIRLSAIDEVIRSFPGIIKHAIMNGGREVHIEVNHKRVRESDLATMSAAVARKIEEQVQFPGQIKVQVMRRFEATAVA